MNTKQFFDALKTKLLAQVWNSSSNKVFNQDSVIVSQNVPVEALRNLIPPIAIIRCGGATSDPEHDEEPDLLMQRFQVAIITYSENDTYGEGVLMGACVADADKSEGKGVLQIEEELFNAIKEMDTDDGITIYSRAKSVPEAVVDEDAGLTIGFRQYEFETLTTTTET